MDKKALVALIPNATKVEVDGKELLIPGNADENKILDQVVAAQIRGIIQDSIQRYNDKEAILTPKELKDLADAGRSLAQFSAEVYKEFGANKPPAAPTPVTPNTDDFEVLDKKEKK